MRPEGAAWDEETEGWGDPGKFLLHVIDFVFFSSLLFPLCPSEETVLPLEKVTCKSQSHTHTHRNALHIHLYTHTHTLITTYRCLWSGRLLHVLLEHAASVTGKRERLESHTWAFPPPLRSDTGDTTRVSLPRMSP